MFDKEKIYFFKRVFHYIRKYKKWFLNILIFSFLSSLFESFSIGSILPLFQILIFQSSKSQAALEMPIPFLKNLQSYFDSENPEIFVLRILIIIAGMIVFKNIFFYFNSIIINKVTNFIKRDLQVHLFNNITNASLTYFNSIKSSKLTSVISTYTENVSNFIFSFLNLFIVAIRLIFYIIILFFISWQISFFIVSVGIFLLPLLFFFLRKIRKIGLKTITEISNLYFRMSEMFNSISLMKIYSNENKEKERFDKISTKVAENFFHASLYLNGINPLIEIFIIIIVVGIIGYLINRSQVEISIYLPIIISYFFVFFKTFSQSTIFFGIISKMFQNIEPFREYEKIIKDTANSKILNGNYVIHSIKKGITFKDVTFFYEPKKNILNEINFFIPTGGSVAFVGPTGSGKSTIINLIAGLYLPSKGKIFIDDRSISELNLSEWRKNIGIVSQESIILNDSVKNNILYGYSSASFSDIVEASKIANIHDFFINLPFGYDTILGEKGARLSGGQKQRISIARAIVRKPEIIIFDEATSSLDNETEKIILSTLLSCFKDRTIITIAHRLSTIQNADIIFVLKNQTIIEQGSHKELIKKNGFYKYLYTIQSNNYF